MNWICIWSAKQRCRTNSLISLKDGDDRRRTAGALLAHPAKGWQIAFIDKQVTKAIMIVSRVLGMLGIVNLGP